MKRAHRIQFQSGICLDDEQKQQNVRCVYILCGYLEENLKKRKNNDDDADKQEENKRTVSVSIVFCTHIKIQCKTLTLVSLRVDFFFCIYVYVNLCALCVLTSFGIFLKRKSVYLFDSWKQRQREPKNNNNSNNNP